MTEGDDSFYNREQDIRCFFIEDDRAFDRVCKGLKSDYVANKIGGLNGVYSFGNALVEPLKINNSLLIAGFTEGLDKELEKKFMCKLK